MPENDPVLDPAILTQMRAMADDDTCPSLLFDHLKRALGNNVHVGTLLLYFKEAFCLALSEAKPVAAFTRNERREILDPPGFDEVIGAAILRHRQEWSVE